MICPGGTLIVENDATIPVAAAATVTNGVLRAGAYVFGYGADGLLLFVK